MFFSVKIVKFVKVVGVDHYIKINPAKDGKILLEVLLKEITVAYFRFYYFSQALHNSRVFFPTPKLQHLRVLWHAFRPAAGFTFFQDKQKPILLEA